MKSRFLVSFLIIVVVMLFPILSMAQVTPPDDTVDTPIDGGLSILLAAGVGYGVKKINDKRKKQPVADKEVI